MNRDFNLFLSNNYNDFAEIYFGGISLHNKSFITKLNNQIDKLKFDFKFNFSKKQRDTIHNSIKGNIGFNYDVQTELLLIQDKCNDFGLSLYLYHNKKTLNGIIHLFIQTKDEFASLENEDFICCTLNEFDKNLVSNIFLNGLAFESKRNQRDSFSGYYSMDFDEVDKKLKSNELSSKDFKQNLSNRIENFLVESDWFQIIEKNDLGHYYVRFSSTDGKRSYSTVWLNESDVRYLKFYIPKMLQILQEEIYLRIIKLYIYSEQKRGENEILTIDTEQIKDLIQNLK